MKIPFVGPSYTSRSRDVNYQVCRNFYLEQDPSGKFPIALYPTPGLNIVTSVSTGPTRGNGVIFGANAYFVLNNMLYSFNGSTLTSVGALNTISGVVQMAASDTQLILVDGTDGWSYDGTTFAQITDAQFPASPTHVRYLDGYFICNDAGTGTFYISALNDGTSWDALDVATAERAPDNLMAIEVTHRELWLFGERTTEVWYNSGAVFPFDPIQGGFIEWGCAAAHSVGKIGNSLMWLAQTEFGGPVVVQAQGFSPRVVSTPAINYEFSTYTTIADAFAIVYHKGGHEFYELTFPAANKTWLYDGLTQQWSELTSGSDRHRITGAVYFANKHFAGDRSTGNIYELDFETYNEVLIAPASATLSRSGGTVTATVTGHSFTLVDRVTIKGANQSAYNGTFDITNVTANTFDYLISSTPTTPATGTITASLEMPIIRTRTSPHIHGNQFRLIHHSLQVDFEAGVGATYGQGQDPLASLRWSDDGGFTYSNTRTTSIGPLGEYRRRAVWRRLGAARDRIYEISISEPVKVVILGADANISQGVN